MRGGLFALLCLLSTNVWAQACIVHSQGDSVDVQVCQQNRNVPEGLFRDGFCQPQLQGQEIEVSYLEQCPEGAFGVCRNAQAGGVAYQQDVYYYGVASDARILKPYCEQQSAGTWEAP